ncbi:hypothetical protein [Dyadobacter sp. LHD-138]|uniref:hypothetical protein n=1 Tax=Dyadobacter sp. LHD-138 TaxID=3071413 RepID=UPI0027E08F9A|nr:hypothetical protein [Dyadobacter sp. LHD-138]MDQ6479799.1 hypothetical protein [Dyadobacter sp. LHD-138]
MPGGRSKWHPDIKKLSRLPTRKKMVRMVKKTSAETGQDTTTGKKNPTYPAYRKKINELVRPTWNTKPNPEPGSPLKSFGVCCEAWTAGKLITDFKIY